MPTIIVETKINASPEICFDLVRDISLSLQRAENTNKEQVPTTPHGEIILGEIVTFEEKRFGFTQKLTVRVTEFEKPSHFTDEMIKGSFKSFKHVHEFISQSEKTLLRDTLIWTLPFGILGRIVDELLLKNHLRKVVMRRNAMLKQIAEKGNLQKT